MRKSAGPDFLQHLAIPASWFIGADVFYQFTQLNGLLGYASQKYRDDEEIRAAYPSLRRSFIQGAFPDEIVSGLTELLDAVGQNPLIVRSSSLLEDSFGTSFAGKYESFFLPNQGSEDTNLAALLGAIASVYASVYSPEALFYRQRMGLVDYDERMGILIQVVQGQIRGRFFLPDAAGVAFSRNQFRWSPRIDRTSGFLRLVWGLGTRAVDTMDGDYPRLVALSHPELRPESEPDEIRRYSQHFVDVLDFERNSFETLPVSTLIRAGAANLPLIAQRFTEGDLQDMASQPIELDEKEVVITFNDLLGHTAFPALMQRMLSLLEQAYQNPVDTEFALLVHPGEHRSEPRLQICLLQCRPQSQLLDEVVRLPRDIPSERRLFQVRRIVPEGRLSGIRYVVYAIPAACKGLNSSARRQLAQVIGQLNQRLEGERYILMGPGRWGSINTELGIPVSYADIFNARALVEIFDATNSPEPSYGTHFFQDLVEARIYPLAIAVDDPATEFHRGFFEDSPNRLVEFLPEASAWEASLRLIDVSQAASGAHIELVMDGEADQALAYLSQADASAPGS